MSISTYNKVCTDLLKKEINGEITTAKQAYKIIGILATCFVSAADAAVMAEWDESDRAKVNVIAGQAGISGGAGAVAANTPRMTLASDDPAIAVLGATSGSKVITDANGTIQQYLRGIVYFILTFFIPRLDPANFVSGLTSAMTGTTSTSLLSAPGSGLYNYITEIAVSNSHGTVGTDIELQDGSGGTTFWVLPAAAVYGGSVIHFDPPLKQPTSNTALYVKNTTTGASTRVSANGYKGA